MQIGVDSFSLTGVYFGVILAPVYLGQRLVPKFRRSFETRDIGPVVVSKASEEESFVVYELFYAHIPTGRFFVKETANQNFGWALKGKSIISFEGMGYFEETNAKDGFNGDNTVKTVHYPLRGEEDSFVAKMIGEEILFIRETVNTQAPETRGQIFHT